ncbi:hypothetical protein ACFQ34_29260 [Pseudonocardia benzenivorans]|uniref:DUF732 domain-containing protein n=1 Tax=Pseudonocardia benzenivorans TaxID=228005 RepID=A0ABW3VQI2_9PSEU
MRKALIGAALGGAVLLSGCGGPTGEEIAVVCESMSQAAKFGGYIDPVTVAHNVLTEDYGLSGSEATETIRTVVQNECPQYRGQL